ncbi:MAG: LacI family DNA-binding transcriptional regulator [Devosia sp.]
MNDRVSRKPATIKTVASDLGLSIATVSRALKGDDLVTEETRARVNESATRLGYRRDFRGVNLRTGRTYTLCALLTTVPTVEFADPATTHLIQGLVAGTAASDFKVVVLPTDSGENQLAMLDELVANGRFDGFILDATEPLDARIRLLLERGARFVSFGRTELLSEHPYFDIDNEDAAYRATMQLAKAGHTRIALIDAPNRYLFSRQRLRGYRRALIDAGIAFDQAYVSEMDIGIRSVHERVSEFLKLDASPTGFVTSNEVAMLGTLRACRDLPEAVFRSLGFVSRDGSQLFDYIQPAVSSLYYPLFDAGKHLTEMLVEVIRGAPVASLQKVERAELIIRSDAPKPDQDRSTGT